MRPTLSSSSYSPSVVLLLTLGSFPLSSYLDNQPYHDSISLNTLYGLLALLIAQPAAASHSHADPPSSSSSSSSSSDDDGSTRHRGGRPAKRAKLDAHGDNAQPGP